MKIGSDLLPSRLMVGSALYPSPEIMASAIRASGAAVVTASLRRQSPGEDAGRRFWDLLRALELRVLPNTAGCRTVEEAVTTAQMGREVFATNWIKLEVIGDDYTLQPDVVALVEAARILADDGFTVLPYTTEDLTVGRRLLDAGCPVLMPWGAPIGSGQGILNPYAMRTLRERLPETTLIVDAGLGKPSHAAAAMEMGFDGVLLNSAIALSDDPVRMAEAFAQAVACGRAAFESGPISPREFAAPSTPALGTPFWHVEASAPDADDEESS